MTKLVAVHNLFSENLAHAIELGGLACPSLAIIRDDIPFDGFGDITLIAPKDMANPRKHPVFDADVYSVRYPPQRFTAWYGDVNDAMEELHKVAKDLGTTYFAGPWQYELEKNGMRGAIELALEDPVALVAFARSLGRRPNIPMKDIGTKGVDATGICKKLRPVAEKHRSDFDEFVSRIFAVPKITSAINPAAQYLSFRVSKVA